MLYKEFGRTGKKVSAVSMGGMRFLADEYKKDVNICAELVLKAHKMGINYFDTAPGYCDDYSESVMGAAFKQMKYGDFYVSTKCGLWNADTADGARKMIEKSLKRLNVPKITFYLMWCIKSLDEYRQMVAKGGIFDGIMKAKEEGLIEHICCSTHAKGNEIAEIVKDGRVEGVMLGYNAANFAYRREGVAACHAANVGVIVMNPLSGGLIPQHPERFGFLTKGTNEKLSVAALKFVVAHNEITTALPGISAAAELDDFLPAVENLPVVNEEYLNGLAKQLGVELDTLCTGCAYCDECPEGIEVPKLLDSYNHAILGNDDMKRVMSKLKNHWHVSPKTATKCTECGKCEELCTQKLPIIERLKKVGAF